jgi:glycosyltransferase involved in cell wall biosynthesis
MKKKFLQTYFTVELNWKLYYHRTWLPGWIKKLLLRSVIIYGVVQIITFAEIMQRVLILGKVWPEPSSSAAGSRMLQLIHVFLSHHWEVSFASAANKTEFSGDLKTIGVKEFSIELNNTSFDRFIKELDPTIVIFDRFSTEEQFGWRVSEQCPEAMRVLDTEDLHCLRAARQKALKEKREFTFQDLFNDVAKRELASIYRCDLSLIISEFEMELLREHFKVDKSLLFHIPFLIEPITKEQQSAWPTFSDRNNFISIGNFLHGPNLDAVVYLKQEIWPLIRKQLPSTELHAYGAYPSHKVFELHCPEEGFLIKGRATSANEVMLEARICLAPLRFGAGLKGKLVDAMANGTPNVTTSIGAESMQGNLSWSGEIADSPEEFADAAVKLYTTKTLWEQAQQNGAKIMNELFRRNKFEDSLISTILSVQEKLNEHRSRNFTGAMLMHHTVLSSKYMALWIEAKNK